MNRPSDISSFCLRALCCAALGFASVVGVAAELPTNTTSMSLADCLAYGQSQSRELERRRLAFDSQELNTRIQEAKFAVNLSAGATHRFEAETTRSSVDLRKEIAGGINVNAGVDYTDGSDEDDESGSASVGLSKILLGGGSVRVSKLELDNGLIDEMITMNSLRRFERDLAFRIKRVYYNLIRGRQTLRVRELRVARATRNLEHARERDRPLDVAIAEIEVPEASADLLRAQRAIVSSLDEMKELIGMDVRADFDIDGSFEFAPETVDLAEDIAFSFYHDEEILNAGLELEKADNSTAATKSRRLPRLTVSGTASQDSDEGADFDGDAEYSAGLALNWNLGRKAERARYRRALITRERQGLDLEDAKQSKIRRLRDLARRLDEAARVITLQEDRVKFQERRVELYTDRWENGEVDILEFIRSQADLENSRIQLITSKTSYMELLGEYRFAIGR